MNLFGSGQGTLGSAFEKERMIFKETKLQLII
jgi:hypothetical protein